MTMNAYTTRGQARISRRDVSAVLRTQQVMAPGAHLAAFERQRGGLAHAEVGRLLKRNGAEPAVGGSRVSLPWRTIGTALVRAGRRQAAAPQRGRSSEPIGAASTIGATD
jgi:hypothetical protein